MGMIDVCFKRELMFKLVSMSLYGLATANRAPENDWNVDGCVCGPEVIHFDVPPLL